MVNKKLLEKYCNLNGWVKKKGILIDVEAIGSDFDSFFVADEYKDDYYKKCEMWVDKEGDDEGIYDDNEIIEHIEEFSDITFKDFKKNEK